MTNWGMFKKNQTKHNKAYYQKKAHKSLIFLVSWIPIILFWIIPYTTQASVQITSKLQSLYQSIKENPWEKKLPGWKNIDNLYETALAKVKEDDIVPLQEAITQTKAQINNTDNCDLLDSDISNIIFSADSTLRSQLENLLQSSNTNQWENIQIPYKDFAKSCDKVMECKTWEKSKSPHLTCQDITYQQFLDNYQNVINSYTMREWIYGKNFFQDANPDNSLFDLLIDVETIGKILFQWFKSAKTAQVLFYSMPTQSNSTQDTNNNTPITNNNTNGNANINWLSWENSNYPLQWLNCPNNIESATQSSTPPHTIVSTQWGQRITWNNTIINQTEKNTTISTTINTTNSNNAHYINGIGTIGNVCLPDIKPDNTVITGWENTWIIPPVQTWYCGDTIINTNEECDDGNNNNSDNCLDTCKLNVCGDGFLHTYQEECDDGNTVSGDGCSALCEQEESPYCGDGIVQTERWEECDDGNTNNNDSCLNTCKKAKCGDGYIQQGKEQCDDGNTTSYDCCSDQCQNEEYLSPEEMALGDMLKSFNELSTTQWPKITEWCFQKCENLPISDRLLCMTDCACGEVSSPALRDTIDAWAFRVKYCMIPAKSIEVIKQWKTVFSIEEIFTAIKSLLIWLRDSGETVKNVETKELMESSMMKNNFGDMFAFNINLSFKSLHKWTQNINTEKQKQLKKNKNLMLWLAQLWDTKSMPKQRDKYVIMADIPSYKANLKNLQDPIELQKEIDNIKENYNKKAKLLGLPDLWNNAKTAIIGEEFMDFLNMNTKFRQTVNTMFQNIYDASSLLRTKIEK